MCVLQLGNLWPPRSCRRRGEASWCATRTSRRFESATRFVIVEPRITSALCKEKSKGERTSTPVVTTSLPFADFLQIGYLTVANTESENLNWLVSRQKQLYEQEKQLRSLQLEAVKQLYKEVQSLQQWKQEVLLSLEVRHSVAACPQPNVNLAETEKLLSALGKSGFVRFLVSSPPFVERFCVKSNFQPCLLFDSEKVEMRNQSETQSVPVRSCASPQSTNSALPVPVSSVLHPKVRQQ